MDQTVERTPEQEEQYRAIVRLMQRPGFVGTWKQAARQAHEEQVTWAKKEKARNSL